MVPVSPAASTTRHLLGKRSSYRLECTSKLPRVSMVSRGPALSTGCLMTRCRNRLALPPATVHQQMERQPPEMVLVKGRHRDLVLRLRLRPKTNNRTLRRQVFHVGSTSAMEA